MPHFSQLAATRASRSHDSRFDALTAAKRTSLRPVVTQGLDRPAASCYVIVANLNRIARKPSVSFLREGTSRTGITDLSTFKHAVSAIIQKVVLWNVAIVLLVLLVGISTCKPRNTDGYCQLPCEKTCPLTSDGVCVALNDPKHGCASTSTCDECIFKNATATCDNDGRCTIGGCKTGFLACDDDETNGCEVNYMSDPKNCGACGKACPEAEQHTTFTCAQGLCVASCRDGYKDCNKRYVDGCETEPDVACDDGI